MQEQGDRIFALVDPRTRRAVDLCEGPGPLGECPRRVPGQPLPCAGHRVIPMSHTSANGLPFQVAEGATGRCPLAWLDADAGDVPGAAPDPEGWLPPGAIPPLSFGAVS